MPIQQALVVDDSRLARIALGKLLKKQGIEVIEAGSATEAFETLKERTPDVIFMDFMMPDMDGYTATKQITSNPSTNAIPVVMCTSQDSEDDKKSAKEHGASGFMTKPTTEMALAEVISSINQLPANEPAAADEAMEVVMPGETAPEPEVKDEEDLRGLKFDEQASSVDDLHEVSDIGDITEAYQEIQEVTELDAVVAKPAPVEAPAIDLDVVVAKAKEAAEDYVHAQLQSRVRDLVQMLGKQMMTELSDKLRKSLLEEASKTAADKAAVAVETAMATAMKQAEDAARLAAEKTAAEAGRVAAEETARLVATEAAQSVGIQAGEKAGGEAVMRLRGEMDQKLVEFSQGVDLKNQVERISGDIFTQQGVPAAREAASEVADKVARDLGSRTLNDGTRYAKQAASDEANAIAQQTMAQVRQKMTVMTIISVASSLVAIGAAVGIALVM